MGEGGHRRSEDGQPLRKGLSAIDLEGTRTLAITGASGMVSSDGHGGPSSLTFSVLAS